MRYVSGMLSVCCVLSVFVLCKCCVSSVGCVCVLYVCGV